MRRFVSPMAKFLVCFAVLSLTPVIAQPPPEVPPESQFTVPDCFTACYVAWGPKSCVSVYGTHSMAPIYDQCSETACSYNAMLQTYSCPSGNPEYAYGKVSETAWNTERIVYVFAEQSQAGYRCLEWQANYCYIAYPCQCAVVSGVSRCVKIIGAPNLAQSAGFAYMILDFETPCTGL